MSVRTRSVHGTTYRFDGLVDLLAKATPKRSGDELAGCAATSAAMSCTHIQSSWPAGCEPSFSRVA